MALSFCPSGHRIHIFVGYGMALRRSQKVNCRLFWLSHVQIQPIRESFTQFLSSLGKNDVSALGGYRVVVLSF